MPMDELAGGVIGAVLRFLGWVLIEVVVEILIKGLGYLVCRPFSKTAPSETAAFFIGLLCWVVIALFAYALVDFLQLDSCLDNGGRYHHDKAVCEYQ